MLLPSNVPAAVLPLLGREWSASAVELGWVVGAYMAGYALAVIIVLPLTDRFPTRHVIVGGAAASVAASLAFALLASDPVSAVVLRVLACAGLAGVYMPCILVVAATTGAERRGLAVGLFVASFYLGSAASFLYAGVVIGDTTGWRDAALSSAGVAAAAIPLALASSVALPPGGGRARLDISVLRDGALARTIFAYSGHAWELFASRAWIAAFLAGTLVARGAGSLEATAEAGRWSALILAAGIPGVFVGGWISDHLGRARTAAAAAFGSGALALGFGALGGASWPLLLAVGFLYSGLMAADSAVYSTSVTELAPERQLGSAQALQAFIGFSAGAVGPPAAGLAIDAGLGWVAVFAIAGAASVLGGLALIPDLRGRRAERREVGE
ncbi:hypothetical protein BH18CHL2_BH18CHL2_07770 [soil metagenome]